MTKRALLLACLFFAHAASADAPAPLNLNTPLVADLSQNAIEIRSDFNGTQLLIFGARNVPGELVIAVRGPAIKATLRQKERIAGMWMHVDQRKYSDLPTYYAIASTKPLSTLASPATLKALGLGERRVIADSSRKADEAFDVALAKALEKIRWWVNSFAPITYFGESLFKTRLELPDTLPSGSYTAEIYLFNHGKLQAFETIPLMSYKVGFDAGITRLARKNGLTYGIVAILMALFGGWFAHRLFNRR